MAATLQVRDYMTMKVVEVDASDSVHDAAEKMMGGKVGCVVVTQNDDIAGVVTKGDIIKRFLLELQIQRIRGYPRSCLHQLSQYALTTLWKKRREQCRIATCPSSPSLTINPACWWELLLLQTSYE